MSYKKQIFKLNDLKKFLTEENSCISLMPTVRLLALPPFFLNDMKSGILYLLNNMLKKYDRSLGGIVIGYQNIKVLMDENTGIIPIGTSETEVNVSVEFYIFQPKIGSHLEGVVNKKSNNHIGCLVHKYFNATILKPDDIDYEDWICKDFNVDDKIIFKVKDLDFTSLLPYIEGIIDNETVLDNNKYNTHKNCGTDSLVVNNLTKSSEREISQVENFFLKDGVTFNEMSDDDFLEREKVKNEDKKVSTLGSNVDKKSGKIDSFTNLRKKKKKKDKEEKKLSVSDDSNYSKKDKYCNDETVTSSAIILDQTSESRLIEKKKKKKKLGDISRDDPEDFATVENVKVNSNHINQTVLEKLDLLEDKNSCDFVKPFKKKKEKKKKDEAEKPKIINKISQGLSSSKVEDSVLYSTLLDPLQSEKMRISFCSPITQDTYIGQKKSEISSTKNLDSTIQINLQSELDKKEKKKKQKKRKREQKELEDFHISKKIKISHSVSSKEESEKNEMNGDEDKLEVQSVTKQLYSQQLNNVKEAINSSDKGSCEEEKKKNKKAKKPKKEGIQNKVSDVNKSSEVQINGAGDIEEKPEAQRNLETEILEELNSSEQQSFKRNKDRKIKENKGKEIFKDRMTKNSFEVNEISKDQKNCLNKEDKKSEVQNILDELLKQEMKRVKNNLKSSESCSGEEKKIKAVVNKQETVREESHLSLYKKLLKEAKSTIELGKNKLNDSFSVKESRKNKNIEDSNLSNVCTSSSKKEDLAKKKKHNKDKMEVWHHTSDKYKNGSMYDVSGTSEKINSHKSLFSDPEQSCSSPVKKMKEANEVETKVGKSLVQNMLDEFCKEEMKRLQSESDKESMISLKKEEKKKNKSEEKSQNSGEKSKILYEKLLKEARSLIDSKEKSPPKKNKKMKQGKNAGLSL